MNKIEELRKRFKDIDSKLGSNFSDAVDYRMIALEALQLLEKGPVYKYATFADIDSVNYDPLWRNATRAAFNAAREVV